MAELDRQSIAGVILGTAVGDALGLPREGLSRKRGQRMFGGPPLRHHFLFGRGMVSDDTEHTCMTGQALLRSPRDADRFARSLAWRLRFWLLGLPAGMGLATARAILKLWVGFSPKHSGVWSAGNGPAMRAALLGVCLGHDPDRLRAYIRASARLTLADPRAERGAFLVALAAHHGARLGVDGVQAKGYLDMARQSLPDADAELLGLLATLEEPLGLQRGVTGYVYHTVIMALCCWLRHPGNFRDGIEEIIDLGGDTDSTAAIVGGMVGATVGLSGIPSEWLNGILEWPRSVGWMQKLADRPAKQFVGGDQANIGPVPLFWPGVIPRNLLFLTIVLAHGLRRLLPPY